MQTVQYFLLFYQYFLKRHLQSICSYFLSMTSTNRFFAMGLGWDADDRGIDAR